MAATDDGSQLFFSSSARLGNSSPARPESRVYRLSSSGIEVFAERGVPVPGGYSSGQGVGQAQLSGDGRTVAITFRSICPSEGPCISPISARGELRGVHAGVLGEGSIQLSRSGRWALLTTAADVQPSAILIDLERNERVQVPGAIAVTSDGSVLVRQGSGQGSLPAYGIWRQGQITPVRLDVPSIVWALSDDGRVLIYSQYTETGESLFTARELTSGKDTVLSSSELSPVLMGISNDGQWVLIRRIRAEHFEGPASVVSTSTGATEPLLLSDGELASAGILSGAGNVAFIATTAGRLVRIGLMQGKPVRVETLIPATPYILLSGGPVPGSRVRLRGTLAGLTKNALTARILLDDRALPVLDTNRDEVAVQIPWELRLGEVSLRLDLPSDSPFRQNELVFVFPYYPEILLPNLDRSTVLGGKIIRGDWSGLVTSQPEPGDIVHMYFTGLGSVRGQVQTGLPTPLDQLFPIEASLRCRFLPYTTEAETLFSGLAPGMIGIYQVSFRFPNEPRPGPLNGMTCSFGGRFGSGGFGFFSSGLP